LSSPRDFKNKRLKTVFVSDAGRKRAITVRSGDALSAANAQEIFGNSAGFEAQQNAVLRKRHCVAF
jgi:hypothetical protein